MALKKPSWNDDPQRREETLAAAVRLVEIARSDTALTPDLCRFLVDKAVWYWTEDRTPGRKYNTRYRTSAALDLQGRFGLSKASPQLRHEHVHERAKVIHRLLDPSVPAGALLESTSGCVVTVSEDAELGAVSASVGGWQRYIDAGLEVIDMASAKPADLTALAQQDASIWS